MIISSIKSLIPLLTFGAHITLVVLITSFFLRKKVKVAGAVIEFIQKYPLHLAFLVAFISMCGSLFYSDIIGYEPCKLCWYQRIFMYSQVFLLGSAIAWRDLAIRRYALLLSLCGGGIALNHYLMQWTNFSILPCSAVGYSVSCSKQFVMEYGYITIPLMALTSFVFIIFIIAVSYIKNSHHE